LSDKQKNESLSKEGAMKKIIMFAMILVMMLVSIGGCCIGRDGRGGRGGEHHRDGGYERDDGHDMRNTINSLREKVTPDISIKMSQRR
jgi:hypothetical protein